MKKRSKISNILTLRVLNIITLKEKLKDDSIKINEYIVLLSEKDKRLFYILKEDFAKSIRIPDVNKLKVSNIDGAFVYSTRRKVRKKCVYINGREKNISVLKNVEAFRHKNYYNNAIKEEIKKQSIKGLKHKETIYDYRKDYIFDGRIVYLDGKTVIVAVNKFNKFFVYNRKEFFINIESNLYDVLYVGKKIKLHIAETKKSKKRKLKFYSLNHIKKYLEYEIQTDGIYQGQIICEHKDKPNLYFVELKNGNVVIAKLNYSLQPCYKKDNVLVKITNKNEKGIVGLIIHSN